MAHAPSDSPGVLIHRYASSNDTPVLAVGRRPAPAPGGLHQLPPFNVAITLAGWLKGAAAKGAVSSGPFAFRLVSITKGRVAAAPFSMLA